MILASKPEPDTFVLTVSFFHAQGEVIDNPVCDS